MKFTFNQISMAILALADLICMMFIYFHPIIDSLTHMPVSSSHIEDCLTGAFSLIIACLIKASSDAKNENIQSQMTEALKNSTPIDNSKNV